MQSQKNENWGKGRGGRPWRRKRARILDRDNYLCIMCFELGILTAATEVDHIIGIAEGGTDDDDNLRSLCSRCHARVTAIQRRNATSKKVGCDADGWPLESK